MSRTIIIIGAGPAGLTAALELLRLNRDDEVFVLEAEDAVGGLAKTINWNGNRFDLGGHRFFSKDDRVNDWWNSIMPMPVVKRKSSIFYNGELIDYPLKLSYKVIRQLGIRKIYRAVRSYIKSQSIKREIASLEDFYISRFGEELYHLFFHDYTLKVWGINPSNIAAEWGPQRIEGVSLGKAFLSALTKHSTEKSMTDHFFFPSEGCGAFWDKVAEEIQHLGGHIITSCEVRRIISIENRITEVICSTPTGEWKIQGGIFFSSLPIRELCLKMSNTVPRVESIAKRLHYRDMVVVGVLLDKAKCANTGLIISKRDEQWIYIQDSEVRFGRIQIINNWSTNMVEHTNDSILIILEYFCCEDDDLWKMKTSDWKSIIYDDLRKLSIVSSTSDLLDYTVQKVSKAYPCYWDGYYDFAEIEEFLDRIDNLYCIGRNGTHHYSNMDQVIISAINAVEKIT